MKVLSIFALFLTLIMSNSAMAVSQDTYYPIQRLYVWTGGNAYVWFDKGSSASHDCSDQEHTHRFVLDFDTAENFDAKFALLLSARVTGEGVKLLYDCVNGDPHINGIRF